MSHTHAQIEQFHRTLYSLCGFPVPPFGLREARAWEAFLFDLSGLAETPGGEFAQADLEKVLTRMRNEKQSGKIGWSMRPITILRDPERFFDMVLECRRAQRVQPPCKIVSHQRPDGCIVAADEKRPDAESAADILEGMEMFKQFREGGR